MSDPTPVYVNVAMDVREGNVIDFLYPSITSLDGGAHGTITVESDKYYAFFYRENGSTTYTFINNSELCDLRVIIFEPDVGSTHITGVVEFVVSAPADWKVFISDNSPNEYALPQSIELVCLVGRRIEIIEQ